MASKGNKTKKLGNALDGLNEAIVKALEDEVSEFFSNFIKHSRGVLKSHGKYATGKLSRSLKYNMNRIVKGERTSIKAKASVDAGSEEGFEYGMTVDKGFKRAPKDFNSDRLKDWMRAKGIRDWVSERRNKDGSIIRKVMTEDQTAFAIMKSIVKRGGYKKTPKDGTDFFKKEFKKDFKDLDKKMKNIITNVVNKELNRLLK